MEAGPHLQLDAGLVECLQPVWLADDGPAGVHPLGRGPVSALHVPGSAGHQGHEVRPGPAPLSAP